MWSTGDNGSRLNSFHTVKQCPIMHYSTVVTEAMKAAEVEGRGVCGAHQYWRWPDRSTPSSSQWPPPGTWRWTRSPQEQLLHSPVPRQVNVLFFQACMCHCCWHHCGTQHMEADGEDTNAMQLDSRSLPGKRK